MWMSDKPLNQQRLARDLAGLLDVLQGRENFLGFVEAFWRSIAREWAGIDALRMDKYLYLVRCYVGKGFECVGRQEWKDEDLLDDYLNILKRTPFSAREGKVPNGLRYHVIDLYVDELDKADTRRTAPVEKILVPLKMLGSNTITKPVRLRVQEALRDERLVDWPNRTLDGTNDDGDEVEREAHEDDSKTSKSAERSKMTGNGIVQEQEDEFEGFGD